MLEIQRNKSNSLKLRLEGIKCLSNLQFKLLEYFYGNNGLPTSKLYASGEFGIHVHGVARGYRFCAILERIREGNTNRGLGDSEVPVFVRIGKVSEDACPIASVIRLQPLNQCNMFIAKSFKEGVTPSPESLFHIFNRKLRSIYNLLGIQTCQLIDEVIEGRTQIINNFSDENTNDKGGWINTDGCTTQIEPDALSTFRNNKFWLALNGYVITYACTEDIDPTVQIRQVYACPTNPFISTIERLHLAAWDSNPQWHEATRMTVESVCQFQHAAAIQVKGKGVNK